jgi:hypothetical protein
MCTAFQRVIFERRIDERRRTEMPSPDKDTVIQRLQELRQQVQNFEKLDSDFYRAADFETWQSDVDRWLRAGSSYTEDQCSEFVSLRFEEIGWHSDRAQAEKLWQHALKRTQHLLDRAVESLQRNWTISNGNAGTAEKPTQGAPTFINLNIQQTSLTVRAALEEIANEIEAKDQAEGTSFKKKVEKLAENPAIKMVLEAGLGAVLKRYAP